MKSATLSRNYSLDAARGILMMLGAFIHAANIYSVAGGWLIRDGQGSYFFDLLVKCIHLFRMPTFFWISGFFCAMTFEHNGSGGLLLKRLPRILIPLVATWATLNVAQMYYLAWFRGQTMVGLLSNGVPLFHLWFLVDLMVFIFLASLALPAFRNVSILGRTTDSLPVFAILLSLASFGFLISAVARSTGMAYDSVLQLTSLFRLSIYAPYFIAGTLMYGHEGIRQVFFRVPLPGLLMALPLALYAQKFAHDPSIVVREIAHFVEILMTWIAVAAVLRVFHDLVTKESLITRFLSDSAYTVYLFHHILVVITGCALIQYPLASWLKFSVVCVTSIGISMLVHTTLVRRNRVIRFLFNGK